MTAPHHQPDRPPLTIATIRAALPQDARQAFAEHIDTTPGPDLPRVLEEWEMTAAVHADPYLRAAAERVADEQAGRRPRSRHLTEEEIRRIHPGLRPGTTP